MPNKNTCDPKLMCDEKLSDKKTWRKWALRNHQDKVPPSQWTQAKADKWATVSECVTHNEYCENDKPAKKQKKSSPKKKSKPKKKKSSSKKKSKPKKKKKSSSKKKSTKKSTPQPKKKVDPHCYKKNVKTLWETKGRFYVRNTNNCTRRVSKVCADTLKRKKQTCLSSKPKNKKKCSR
jgi:hypothetical protein